MRYDLRESDETSGLHARLKSTKFTEICLFLADFGQKAE